MVTTSTGSPLRNKSFEANIRITCGVRWQVKEVHMPIQELLKVIAKRHTEPLTEAHTNY